MRHLLSLRDLSREEIQGLLDEAGEFKRTWLARHGRSSLAGGGGHDEGQNELGRGIWQEPEKILAGKSLAMIFEKSSTRTRLAFELAMAELGGRALFLSANQLQLGRGEPVKDTARVIGSMADFLLARVNQHSALEEFARYSAAPVINALSERYHPTQVLADLLTIREFAPARPKIAFIGDINNMANSWIIASAILGLDLVLAAPAGYAAEAEVLDLARAEGEKSGARLAFTTDKFAAAKDRDVLITDTWISMGQEDQKEARLRDFEGFIIDEELMSLAAPGAILLHCLPAYRGYELSEEVFERHSGVIFEEARNRLFIASALLKFLDQGR